MNFQVLVFQGLGVQVQNHSLYDWPFRVSGLQRRGAGGGGSVANTGRIKAETSFNESQGLKELGLRAGALE